MLILGIESTCDETGVALVEDGRRVIASELASSSSFFEKWGGVIPEIAAREQVKVIVPVLSQVLDQYTPDKIHAIAVSSGPGLIGSLLIGVETAKVLALAWGKPLIAVNHLVGHIYANWLGKDIIDSPQFPLIALIVSGGHTDLVLMKSHRDFKLLGSTLDDAAGEAYDKVAKVLGLGYPGGPLIEELATRYRVPVERTFSFPRPMIGENNFDFSFSGLKTAVVNRVRGKEDRGKRVEGGKGVLEDGGKRIELHRKVAEEIAYEFQNAAVEVLVFKTLKAAKKFGVKAIVVGGGVAANQYLRSTLENADSNFKIFFPEKKFSVDNGAMIASAAFFKNTKIDALELSADTSLHF